MLHHLLTKSCDVDTVDASEGKIRPSALPVSTAGRQPVQLAEPEIFLGTDKYKKVTL